MEVAVATTKEATRDTRAAEGVDRETITSATTTLTTTIIKITTQATIRTVQQWWVE